MKEIIGIVVVIATALSGNAALKRFHDTVRKAALEKSAVGLPPLTKMAHALQRKGTKDRTVKK